MAIKAIKDEIEGGLEVSTVGAFSEKEAFRTTIQDINYTSTLVRKKSEIRN